MQSYYNTYCITTNSGATKLILEAILILYNTTFIDGYIFSTGCHFFVLYTFLSPELIPLVATILYKLIEFSVRYEILGCLKLRNSLKG